MPLPGGRWRHRPQWHPACQHVAADPSTRIRSPRRWGTFSPAGRHRRSPGGPFRWPPDGRLDVDHTRRYASTAPDGGARARRAIDGSRHLGVLRAVGRAVLQLRVRHEHTLALLAEPLAAEPLARDRDLRRRNPDDDEEPGRRMAGGAAGGDRRRLACDRAVASPDLVDDRVPADGRRFVEDRRFAGSPTSTALERWLCTSAPRRRDCSSGRRSSRPRPPAAPARRRRIA